MLVLLNVGNTNLKLGLAEDGRLLGARRVTTRREVSADELELTLEGLLSLDGRRLGDARRMVISSVVPVYDAALGALAARRGLRVDFATHETVPIPVRVDRPAEVGADRLVNALAAGRLHGAPAVVIDFGTAITLDAVAADGAYVGGAIAPGLEIGLEALAERTAKLPRIELRQPRRAIGRDTISAMRSGAVYGALGAVRELRSRVAAELAEDGGDIEKVCTILTGGIAAQAWFAELVGADVVDPELTLRGLLLLAGEGTAGEATPGAPAVRTP
ncbi:MAG TPA: type III pantothenate kinase [Candidatus Limnocylindrales bacterium]|nr:type III pantothenate kinase [Candidatus Limnocylindrales bacterium]